MNTDDLIILFIVTFKTPNENNSHKIMKRIYLIKFFNQNNKQNIVDSKFQV